MENSKKESKLYDSFDDLTVKSQRTDFDYENDPDISYELKKSSASCAIEDIESITFGAFNSRFWALRKHISCLQDQQIENLPFYAW